MLHFKLENKNLLNGIPPVSTCLQDGKVQLLDKSQISDKE
ncbi:hypothetical protein GMES_3943 [Paraglaciecola mesophila KMM 241]|uniref:Uncharacterized protein n=1 Tax=Paraglaciecola mesophila KMM 241 TaxID=1128912 RepID=K6YQE6_9ALTE|nr:hypothetical protein GMES_3943 [Paraglaciecola mesophila KMM 241]